MFAGNLYNDVSSSKVKNQENNIVKFQSSEVRYKGLKAIKQARNLQAEKIIHNLHIKRLRSYMTIFKTNVAPSRDSLKHTITNTMYSNSNLQRSMKRPSQIVYNITPFQPRMAEFGGQPDRKGHAKGNFIKFERRQTV